MSWQTSINGNVVFDSEGKIMTKPNEIYFREVINPSITSGITSYFKYNYNLDDTYNLTSVDISNNINYDSGKYNQSLLCDGISTFVRYNSKVLNIGAKSIVFWVNFTGGDATFISNTAWSQWGTYSSGCAIFWDYRGLSFTLIDYLSHYFLISASSYNFSSNGLNNLPDGNWRHVVCTWDGTTNTNKVKIYVDSILIRYGTSSNTETTSPQYNLIIGAENYSNTRLDLGKFFNGKIDDLIIYDRELTQTEITTLYNETHT